MAEEKLQYTLTLATKATGTGAKETAADLQKVAAATGSVNDKAKISQWAFYDLDAEMKKTSRTSETLTGGVTKVGKSTGNASQSLLLFSQGLEDSAYGIRGVLNNIPGLIISLGGTAGLAGAISIAAVGFSMLYDWLGKTEVKASDTKEQVDAMAAALSSLKAEDLQKARDAIRITAEETAALKQDFAETHKANDAYAVTALANAEKQAAAERSLNELLGIRVDKFAELAAQAAADSARRDLEAQQAIAASQARVKEAEDKRKIAADAFSAQLKLAEENKKDAAAAAKKLELLQKQRDEMIKLTTILPLIKQESDPGVFMQNDTPTNGKEVRAAKATLASPAFQAELLKLRDDLDQLEAAGKQGILDVRATKVAVMATENQLADVRAGEMIAIQGLQESVAKETTLAKIGEVAEIAKLSATQLEAAVEQMTPATAAQQAAKDAILKATADGIIAATESAALGQNLVILTGGLQSGMTTVNGNVQTVIQMMFQFQAQQQAMAAELDRLRRSRQSAGFQSSNTLPAR